MQPALTRRTLLGAPLALAAVPAFARGDALAGELAAHLDRVDDFSGAVLLARGGKVLLKRAWGLAERNFAVPNRLDTRFNIASMGKMFTSLAVLQLVAAGRLGLEDRLAKHLPDWPNREAAEAVTIAQLLGHTSGMGNYHAALVGYAGPPLVDNRDYLPLFAKDPLAHAPGSAFLYSNGGYLALGMVIEKLSGEPYFAHLDRTIFKPLGMASTGPADMDLGNAGTAYGYSRALEPRGKWRSNVDPRTPRGTAAGGSYSTVADMHAFGQAVLAGTLLPPALMEAWTRGRTPYPRGLYALGMSDETIGTQRILGHSGGHPGVACELLLFPALGTSCVILTNGEVDGFSDALAFVKRALAGNHGSVADYWFTRDLIDRTLAGGVEAGVSFAAKGKPREGVIDVTALKHLHHGEDERAFALLRLNTRIFPQSSWALWSHAEALRVAGRRGEALAAYRTYQAREPEDADAKRWIAALSG